MNTTAEIHFTNLQPGYRRVEIFSNGQHVATRFVKSSRVDSVVRSYNATIAK